MRRGAPPEVIDLLLHEARLLDERMFEEWLELLTDDIVYWVPASPDQETPEREASTFWDDRKMLEARILRLRHPKIWSQLPNARTVRLVSNITVDDSFDKDGTVQSNVLVLDYRPMVEHRRSEQRLFGGACEHQLVRIDGGFKIRRKTVRLVNCDATLANLAIPF
jgi:benzoate/toluate 1,2-dioxygenase beta subunit